MMQQQPVSEILAHWQYTPDEWRAFSDLEVNSTRFDLTDSHLTVIGAGVVIFGLAAAAAKGGARAAVVITIVGCGFLLALFVLSRVLKNARRERLEVRPTDIWITPGGICINGGWSCWGTTPDNFLHSVHRLLAEDRAELSITPGPRVDVLSFRVVYVTKVRRGTLSSSQVWRVPVPAGRGLEADAVVRWFAERLEVTSTPVGGPLNGGWPHEFAGSICQKCGMSAAAAMEFEWSCPNS